MKGKLTIERNGEIIEIKNADELRKGDFIPQTNLGPARYAGRYSNNGRTRHTFYIKQEHIDEVSARGIRIEREALNIDEISETSYAARDARYSELNRCFETGEIGED